MTTVLLVVHLLIAIAMIVIVLLQPSQGGLGGLGGGGGGAGGGGMGALMSSRGAATMLTRATAVLAACFMGTSIALTILAGGDEAASVLDEVPVQEPDAASPTQSSGGEAAGGGSGDGDQPEVPVE